MCAERKTSIQLTVPLGQPYEFKRTKYHDQGKKERAFCVGDSVYLHVPAVPSGHARKFHRPCRGPFRVLKCIPPVNYVIEREKQL